MNIDLHNRPLLYSRHRLSHRQIDLLLNESGGKATLSEKLHQLKAIQQFLQLTDRLRAAQLPFLCFKGVLLSYRIYKDATVRKWHDLDILTHRAEIDRILQLLFGMGYHLSEGVIWPRDARQRALLLESTQHLSLHNPSVGSVVEVHWRLLKGLPLRDAPMEALMKQEQTEMIYADRTFRVFTPEFELLFLLMHGSRHAWFRLKWLVDILDYPMAEVNPVRFSALVKQLSAGPVIEQTNALLKIYFGKSLPFARGKRVNTYLLQYALKAIEDPAPETLSTLEQARLYRYHWHLYNTLWYKLTWCRSLFFRASDLSSMQGASRVSFFFYRFYSFLKRRIFRRSV